MDGGLISKLNVILNRIACVEQKIKKQGDGLTDKVKAELDKKTDKGGYAGTSQDLKTNIDSVEAGLNTKVDKKLDKTAFNKANLTSSSLVITGGGKILDADTTIELPATVNTAINKVSVIESKVNTNTTAIEQLKPEVARNTNNIGANSSKISTNTSSIAVNTGEITNLKTRMGTAETKITNNTNKIAVVNNNLEDFKTQIKNGSNSVASLTLKVQENTAKNTAQDTEINNLKAKDVELNNKITANTNNITRVDGKVSALESKINNKHNITSSDLTVTGAGKVMDADVNLALNPTIKTNVNKIPGIESEVNSLRPLVQTVDNREAEHYNEVNKKVDNLRAGHYNMFTGTRDFHLTTSGIYIGSKPNLLTLAGNYRGAGELIPGHFSSEKFRARRANNQYMGVKNADGEIFFNEPIIISFYARTTVPSALVSTVAVLNKETRTHLINKHKSGIKCVGFKSNTDTIGFLHNDGQWHRYFIFHPNGCLLTTGANTNGFIEFAQKGGSLSADKYVDYGGIKVEKGTIPSDWSGSMAEEKNAMSMYIDLTDAKYDQNTYYPVVYQLSKHDIYELSVMSSLNNSNKPTWATHASGFSCYYRFRMRGSGWGANQMHIQFLEGEKMYCDKHPVAEIKQDDWSSRLIMYMRGGGKYHFRVASENGYFVSERVEIQDSFTWDFGSQGSRTFSKKSVSEIQETMFHNTWVPGGNGRDVPFKMGRGTLLTTPVDGAIERDTSGNYWVTIGTERFSIHQPNVSGVNLIPHSNIFNNRPNTGPGINLTWTTEGNFKIVTNTGQAYMVLYANAYDQAFYKKYVEDQLSEGDWVTASFWIKRTAGNGWVRFYAKSGVGYYMTHGHEDFNATEFKRTFVCFKWKKANEFRPHLEFGPNSTFEFRHWKMEKGYVPTEWSPAPLDDSMVFTWGGPNDFTAFGNHLRGKTVVFNVPANSRKLRMFIDKPSFKYLSFQGINIGQKEVSIDGQILKPGNSTFSYVGNGVDNSGLIINNR